MENHAPHLIIEEGPETGREIVIPAAGARLGRAVENDISIADAAMSRFQCRMYFRDGFLHVMDLGSTNETLVNDKPVSDTGLRFGDEILIGESRLKVINDGLHDPDADAARAAAAAPASAPPEAEPAPAPILFNPDGDEPEPAAPPVHEHEPEEVDLGLGRRAAAADTGGDGDKRSPLMMVLVALATMLAVVAIGGVVLLRTAPPPPSAGAGNAAAADNRIRVEYEKLISGNGNIFRYAISLAPDGTLQAEVHDLRQQRDIVREDTVAPERMKVLREQLEPQKDTFLGLQNEYEGLAVGDHEAFRLTLIFGSEAKTVEVANQLEPDTFKEIRERIEAFANNELGLINIDIPPEELRARADESWENAQQLYARRDVKNENLWQAIKKLRDVQFLLESIEPKPEYFEDAVTLRQEWRRQLDQKLQRIEFEAVRAYKVGDARRSAELFRQILATVPDRAEPYHKQAQTMLVQIEQELN